MALEYAKNCANWFTHFKNMIITTQTTNCWSTLYLHSINKQSSFHRKREFVLQQTTWLMSSKYLTPTWSKQASGNSNCCCLQAATLKLLLTFSVLHNNFGLFILHFLLLLPLTQCADGHLDLASVDLHYMWQTKQEIKVSPQIILLLWLRLMLMLLLCYCYCCSFLQTLSLLPVYWCTVGLYLVNKAQCMQQQHMLPSREY